MKRIGIILVCMMLMISFLVFFPTENVKANGNFIYVDANGLEEYTKIQEAIDNAYEGDTIFVYSGVYDEYIVINKSINLVGENKDTTFITGYFEGIIVDPWASIYILDNGYVNISGFTIGEFSGNGIYINESCSNNIIKENNFIFDSPFFNPEINSTNAIYLNKLSNNNTISNNYIRNYYTGIKSSREGSTQSPTESNNNTIIENIIINNNYGIILGWCTNYTIKYNTISNNLNGGIGGNFNNSEFIDNDFLFNKDFDIYGGFNHNIISDNSFSFSSYSIMLSGSNNSILNNDILNNDYGIYMLSCQNSTLLNNDILYNDYGIYMLSCQNSTVLNNNILHNNYSLNLDFCEYINIFGNKMYPIDVSGITLYQSSNNTIKGNVISDGVYGIFCGLESSCNTISRNNIQDNDLGIYFGEDSNNSLIYNNNFLDNDYNGADACSNKWNNSYPSGGNYWSDHVGTDNYKGVNQDIPGSDGIVDQSYAIFFGDNIDFYPLMEPWTIPNAMLPLQDGENLIDVTDEVDTAVEVDTNGDTIISFTQYPSNPHPGTDLPSNSLNKFIDIEIEDESLVEWPIYIRIYYTNEDLGEVNENSLSGIYYWDETGDNWEIYDDTGVEKNNINGYEGYVWANAWHLTQLTLAGVIDVKVDIKPGSYPNSINVNSKGNVPVAILTNYSFDANIVNPGTIVFLGANPVHWAMEDVDNDGDIDMILQFKTQELNFSMLVDEGDQYPYAYLYGETISGETFFGKDTVRLMGSNIKSYNPLLQFLIKILERFPLFEKILNQIIL